MTPYEKRLLRNWVASGHSVHENAGSKYICLAGGSPPFDFLDVYCYPTNSNPSISRLYDRLISQITIRHYFSLSLNAAFFIA